MNKITSCETFQSLLDAYLDNELDNDTRSQMDQHAKACPECGAQLDAATRLLTLCAEMDEGLAVPLDVQAGWRAAVRVEAERKRKSGSYRWIGRLGSVAAALVVLVGGTMAFRNGQLAAPSLMTNQSAYTMNKSDEVMDDVEYAMAPDARSLSGSTAGADIFETDGGPVMESATGAAEAGGTQRQAKVIKNASRDIESSNYDADLQMLRDLVSDFDGQELSFYAYEPQTEQKDNWRWANLDVRIPTDQAEEFLTRLDESVTVTARRENAQDITDSYYDMSSRLDQQKALLIKYQSYMASAQSIEEILSCEEKIAATQSEIESMEGIIRNWDTQVDYSQVSLSLQEVAPKDALKGIDSENLGERIRASFYDSINMFTQFMQDMAVFVVLVWPWLVLLIVVIIIVCIVIRRRRKRRNG